jgi:hypothetical protein
VLAKEAEPLGIKVTIIEPGGSVPTLRVLRRRSARAGPNTTVGRVARFQRDFNGAQPGDPAKAASVITHIANLDQPTAAAAAWERKPQARGHGRHSLAGARS